MDAVTSTFIPLVIVCLAFSGYIGSVFWVWADAEDSGGRGFMWAVIVFLSWPLGLAVYVIARHLREPRPSARRRKRSRRRRRR